MGMNKMVEIFNKHFGYYSNFSEDDYLHAFGKGSVSLLYSTLFLPDFIELESVVFLKSNVYDEGLVRTTLTQVQPSKIHEVELSYNYLEVGYIFDCPGRDLIESEEVLLANRIRNAWDGWLRVAYPSRKFTVQVVETEDSVAVQFYENR